MPNPSRTGAFLALCLASIFAVSFDFQQNTQHPLLNLAGVELSPNSPFEVAYELQRNEKITLSVQPAPGEGNALDDLNIAIFQAGAQSPGMPYSGFSNPYIVPQDGIYKIKLFTRRKTVLVDMGLSSNLQAPADQSTPKDTTNISSVYIGNKNKKNPPIPSIRIKAKKGEYLTAQTNLRDPSLDYIKYEFSGDGQTYYLADQKAHLVPRDGEVYFKFFLDKPKFSVGSNVDGFLSNNRGIRLDNLQINRYRPSSGAPAPPSVVQEDKDNSTEQLMEFLKEQDKKAAKRATEDSLALDAMRKRLIDTFAFPLYQIAMPLTAEIPPMSNIHGSGNRKCFLIENLVLNAPEFFAYAILTGEDAEARFQKASDEAKRAAANKPGATGINSLLHGYSGQLIDGMQYNRRKGLISPPIQAGKNKQYIEYALVDYANSRAFLRNDIFVPFNEGLAEEGVDIGYGNSPVPSDPANPYLFLCVCNRSYLSPVHIFFTWESFAIASTEALGQPY